MDSNITLDITTVAPETTTKEPKGLAGINLILFIAFGILSFVVLFIFAKRQIMRFALKSRKGPHVPIGFEAPKNLIEEIYRRMDRTQKVKYEPKLFSNVSANMDDPSALENFSFCYRMKAIDSFSLLDKELRDYDHRIHRKPGKSMHMFLLGLQKDALRKANPHSVARLAQLYEDARHDPAEFGIKEYKEYTDLLKELLISVKSLRFTPKVDRPESSSSRGFKGSWKAWSSPKRKSITGTSEKSVISGRATTASVRTPNYELLGRHAVMGLPRSTTPSTSSESTGNRPLLLTENEDEDEQEELKCITPV